MLADWVTTLHDQGYVRAGNLAPWFLLAMSFGVTVGFVRTRGVGPLLVPLPLPPRYVCYFENNTQLRLTGCWDPRFEFKDWGNVVCTPEGSYIEDTLQSLCFGQAPPA